VSPLEAGRGGLVVFAHRGPEGRPVYPFDPRGPFRPLVLAYLGQLCGLMEVFTLALTRQARAAHAETARGLLELGSESFSIDARPGHTPHPWDLLGDGRPPPEIPGALPFLYDLVAWATTRPQAEEVLPVDLPSRSSAPPIRLDREEFLRELRVESPSELLPALVRSGCGLLVDSFEAARAHSDRGPTWEFFRHCRNAAGHGASFNLLGNEPTRPAAWRGLVVERSLQGTSLFHGIPGVPGLIGLGDVVHLLWDIERSTPGILRP
jgi:hypothetical protein